MKYQQISVDLVNMVFTAVSYLALAGAVWIFLRLLQACFWLPRHLRKQNDVQQMLQEKVSSYEKYILECEKTEKEAEESGEVAEKSESEEKVAESKVDEKTREEKWKERRECLEMLKRELRRVQNGGDIYDWDYLLEEDEKPENETNESEDNENSNLIEGATKKSEICSNDTDTQSEIEAEDNDKTQTIEEKKEL